MLTLSKKLRRDTENNNNIRISVRDRLLVKEFSDLPPLLPPTAKIVHKDPDKLHEFQLVITPDSGYWATGKFVFDVVVTEEYNFAPPLVKCTTKIFHPNITEDGAVCLSLLRQSSIDELGWAPTRCIKDVVWGVDGLFSDLLNFDDPLNPHASEMYQKNPEKFAKTVKEFIDLHCI